MAILRLRRIKKRVFAIVETAAPGDKASRVFDVSLVALIVMNVAAVVFESFREVAAAFELELWFLEVTSLTIFSVEYAIRLWTAELKYPDKPPVFATIRYAVTFMAIVDLAAILPFFVPSVLVLDLRVLRILRVTRILRVMKAQRYSKSLQLIGAVLKSRASDLAATFFVTFLRLLLASSIMFYVENEAQPEAFPNILAAGWWAIATLTTVGYGDVYPVTVAGKILSGFIAILGIGLVALPTGILSSGFLETLHEPEATIHKTCPHCGKPID